MPAVKLKRSPLKLDCAGAGEKGRSRTEQQHTDACCLDKKLSKFRDIHTGRLDLPEVSEQLSEVVNVNLNADGGLIKQGIHARDQVWYKLPEDIRMKFGNDPHLFMDYYHDPANEEQLVKDGLKKRPGKVGYADKNGVIHTVIDRGLNAEQKKDALAEFNALSDADKTKIIDDFKASQPATT